MTETQKTIPELQAEIAELQRKVTEKEVAPLETIVAALQKTAFQGVMTEVETALANLTPGRANRYRSFLETVANLRIQASQDLSVVQSQLLPGSDGRPVAP